MRKTTEALSDYPPNGAFIACWYSVNKDGNGVLRYFHTGTDRRYLKSLLSDMQFEIHISTREIFGARPIDEV